MLLNPSKDSLPFAEPQSRKASRFLKFSLRQLLLFVVLLTIAAAIAAEYRRRALIQERRALALAEQEIDVLAVPFAIDEDDYQNVTKRRSLTWFEQTISERIGPHFAFGPELIEVRETPHDPSQLSGLCARCATGYGLTEACLCELAPENLQHVDLSGNSLTRLRDFTHDGKDYYDLQKHLTRNSFLHLSKAAQLEQLILGGCIFDEPDLDLLAACRSLKTFGVSSPSATGRFLQTLPAEHLTTLLISGHTGARLDDQACRCIQRFTKLKHLYIAQTGITNDELRAVGRLQNLERLNITGNRITEEALETLPAQFPNLKELSVMDIEVSEDRVKRFRARYSHPVKVYRGPSDF